MNQVAATEVITHSKQFTHGMFLDDSIKNRINILAFLEKIACLHLRCAMIVAISFFILFESVSKDVNWKPLYILLFFVVFNALINKYSQKIFDPFFSDKVIFTIDALFVASILYTMRIESSDFYLIFYMLVILLVTINKDVRTIFIVGALVSILYAWMLISLKAWQMDEIFHFFVRIPFVFSLTLFYSFIMNRFSKTIEIANEYKTKSMYDELTCLPNRRFMNEFMKMETNRAIRHNRPISILIIDIDDFKKINDTYGHDTGDRILIELSKLIVCSKREYDVVVRYGGEEFIYIAPETSDHEATLVAKRILEKVSETVFDIDGNKICLTVSIGASTFLPQKHSSRKIQKVINLADEALYRSKCNGKNTFIFFES